MKNKLAYLLLFSTILGQMSTTSYALTTEFNTESTIQNNDKEINLDEKNKSLQRAFNVTYSLYGNESPLKWPDAMMKIEKDDATPVTIRFVSRVGNALSSDRFTQRIKLSEGVTVQSLPTINASVGMTYSYKYSVDGVNYSSTPPADISQIKYIYYSGTAISYQSFTANLSLTVDWDKAHSGKNLMAEFFENSDENKVGQLFYDSYRMVTATYEDESGESLNPPISHYGALGGQYSTEALDIPGYSLTEVPENAGGTYTDEDQVVKYIYKQNPKAGADVTINYVDEDGNAIPSASSQTISGNVGDSYDATTDVYKLTIDGYTLDESKLPTNAKGTLSDQAQTITYVYTKNPVKAADVTIKYVDEDGNKVSDDVVKSGNVGDAYTTEQKAIEGYTFKEVQGNTAGQFTDQAQTVTYVYTKNEIPNITGTVLVKYVNTDGSKISEDIVKSGTVGEGYSTEKKDIKGYTFKEVQGSTTGQFTEQVQIVTYVYTKNKVNPVNSETKPEIKPSSNDKNNNQGTISSTQHDLPATGENERIAMMSIILGLILIALATVVSIFRFKKANK